MASDPKAAPNTGSPASKREKGVRIFTYPKIIFIFPTLIASVICFLGMTMIPDVTDFNYRREMHKQGKTLPGEAVSNKQVEVTSTVASVLPVKPDPTAFRRRENVLGLIFLTVLFLNLMILAIDFPRFAIFGLVLGGTTIAFFLLWLGVYVEIIRPVTRLLEGVYVVANAEFYFLMTLIILAIYGVVFLTRWLDYWEILPNEILHHHGPLSDLERYPTLNLKFDKEIPDVFEHMMFGAGKLVLHVADERRAIVLDTVLHVSKKEDALKKLMSRLEVRVTTDQEVSAP